MEHDSRRTAPPFRHSLPGIAGATLFAGLLSACALDGLRPLQAEQPADDTASCTEIDIHESTSALIAYHAILDEVELPTLRSAQSALADSVDEPMAQMHSAILLSHPRSPVNAARALELFDAVLASEHPDACTVQPLAQLLSSHVRAQVQLRQRLERTEAQRKASDEARADLQQKLDALTEIERTLPARPNADVTPPQPTEESDPP